MTPGPIGAPPVIDDDVVDTLRAIGGSDPAGFIHELFTTLLDQGAATIALCASPDADATAVAAAAHRLKGAAGTIGAMRLSAAAEALEAGARDSGRRRQLVSDVQAELDVVRRSSPAIP